MLSVLRPHAYQRLRACVWLEYEKRMRNINKIGIDKFAHIMWQYNISCSPHTAFLTANDRPLGLAIPTSFYDARTKCKLSLPVPSDRSSSRALLNSTDAFVRAF